MLRISPSVRYGAMVLCSVVMQVSAHDGSAQPMSKAAVADAADTLRRAQQIKKMLDEQQSSQGQSALANPLAGLMNMQQRMQETQKKTILAQQQQYARSLSLIPEEQATRLKAISHSFNQLYHRALISTFIDQRLMALVPLLEEAEEQPAHAERVEHIMQGVGLLRSFEASDGRDGYEPRPESWSLYLRTPEDADPILSQVRGTLSQLSHDLRVLANSMDGASEATVAQLTELADLCRHLARRDMRALLQLVAHALAAQAHAIATDLAGVEKELTALLPEQPGELMTLAQVPAFQEMERYEGIKTLLARCQDHQRTLQLFIGLEKTLLSPAQWQGYHVCDMAARVVFALMGMQHRFQSKGDNNLLFVPWFEWSFIKPFYMIYYSYTFLATRSDSNMAPDPRIPSITPSIFSHGLSRLQENTVLDLLCRGGFVSEEALEEELPAIVLSCLRVDGYQYPPLVFGSVLWSAFCDIGWPVIRDSMPDWLSGFGTWASRLSDDAFGGMISQTLFKSAPSSLGQRMNRLLGSCALQVFYMHLKNPTLTVHMRDVLLAGKDFADGGYSVAHMIPGTGSAACTSAKELWRQTTMTGMYLGQTFMTQQLTSIATSALSQQQWQSVVKTSGGVLNKKVLGTLTQLGLTKLICVGLESQTMGRQWQDVSGISGDYAVKGDLYQGSIAYMNYSAPVLYPIFESFGQYATYSLADHLAGVIGHKMGRILFAKPIKYLGEQIVEAVNPQETASPLVKKEVVRGSDLDQVLAMFCQGKTEEEIVELLKTPMIRTIIRSYESMCEQHTLYGQAKMAFVSLADMLTNARDMVAAGHYNLEDQAAQHAAAVTIAELLITLGDDLGLLEEGRAYDFAVDYMRKRTDGDEDGAREVLASFFDEAMSQWHAAVGGLVGEWSARGGLRFAWRNGLSGVVDGALA